jgi:hypothetical protein
VGVCERGPASQSKGIGSRNEHGIAGFEQTRGTEPFDVRQGLIELCVGGLLHTDPQERIELDGGDQVVILVLLEPCRGPPALHRPCRVELGCPSSEEFVLIN